ncbi:hypothetical protein NKG94_19740 [Micromonospora sp. M12]
MGTFERRSSVRTWLYRITTNVCLTVIEGRGRRTFSSGLDSDDLSPWLEPFPTDPVDLVTARESVRLAFVAGLQYLAPDSEPSCCCGRCWPSPRPRPGRRWACRCRP